MCIRMYYVCIFLFIKHAPLLCGNTTQYVCMSYCTESVYFQTSVPLYSRISRSAAVQSECAGRQEPLSELVCS